MKKYYELPSNTDTKYELKLELTYQLGGHSYATYEKEERGLYLHISTVNRDNSRGYLSETTAIFSDISESNIIGGKILVKELKRKSAKQFTIYSDKIFDIADKFAELWIDGNTSEAFDLLKETTK